MKQKFNFIEAHLLVEHKKKEKESQVPYVNINPNGYMLFSSNSLTEYNLSGRGVKLVCDPGKRLIGFKKLDGILDENSDGWNKTSMRIIRKSKTGGAGMGVGKLLALMGAEKVNHKRLPIQKYTDTMLGEIYYVTVPKSELSKTTA